MRISDWSSDVCSSDLPPGHRRAALLAGAALGTLPDLDSLPIALLTDDPVALMTLHRGASHSLFVLPLAGWLVWAFFRRRGGRVAESPRRWFWAIQAVLLTHPLLDALTRSEEHTSELQSLMRISYAVFCLKKKNNK